MLESKLRERIIATTFIVRFNTGDCVISLVIGHVENIISLFFPYELTTNGELIPFCNYAKNRRFEIGAHNCQFMKSPCDDIAEKFFDRVLKDHPESFKEFVTYFTQLLVAEGETIDQDSSVNKPAEDPVKERVLH